MKPLFLLIALLLSACASKHELAMPAGEWRPLNPDKWDYDPNAITTPPTGQMARAG